MYAGRERVGCCLVPIWILFLHFGPIVPIRGCSHIEHLSGGSYHIMWQRVTIYCTPLVVRSNGWCRNKWDRILQTNIGSRFIYHIFIFYHSMTCFEIYIVLLYDSASQFACATGVTVDVQRWLPVTLGETTHYLCHITNLSISPTTKIIH